MTERRAGRNKQVHVVMKRHGRSNWTQSDVNDIILPPRGRGGTMRTGGVERGTETRGSVARLSHNESRIVAKGGRKLWEIKRVLFVGQNIRGGGG